MSRLREINMKINFWQAIGIVLVVVGLALVIWRETRPAATPTDAEPPQSQSAQ